MSLARGRLVLACCVALPALASEREHPDLEFLEFLGLGEEEGWDEFFDALPPEQADEAALPPMTSDENHEQD